VSSNVCDAFITTWNLATAGSGATQLSFGFTTSGAVSYSWKEVGGSANGAGTFTGSTLSLTGLPTGKTIELTIAPANFQRIISSNSNVDKNRLTNVKQWGTTAWTSMRDAFFGCSNLNITATDIPNLASVSDMSNMFQNCSNLSTVPNINSWNTSSATNMASLFRGCSKFNENIGNWNTAKVISMARMFMNSSFNQNIGSWNTAKVRSMLSAFESNTSFNQDISGWNTAAVTEMPKMFKDASAFNQYLGSWTLNASVDLNGMLGNCGMDCENYSATLIGWNSQSVTGRTLGATGRTYGAYAAATRTTLTGTKSWTITDGGQGTCTDPGSLVQMIDFGGFIKHDVTNLDKPLNVYPNPATDLINLEFNGIAPSSFNVLVMDMSGKVIIKLNGVHAESNLYTLPLNGIVSGMYVVKLSDELGNTTINRFNIK
jgi:surface protein